MTIILANEQQPPRRVTIGLASLPKEYVVVYSLRTRSSNSFGEPIVGGFKCVAVPRYLVEVPACCIGGARR